MKTWNNLFILSLPFFVVLFALILTMWRIADRTEMKRAGIEELTESTCTAAGGGWNSCGSACRGSDVDACITVCVEECGCALDDQCPQGYMCGEFIDGNGICVLD